MEINNGMLLSVDMVMLLVIICARLSEVLAMLTEAGPSSKLKVEDSVMAE